MKKIVLLLLVSLTLKGALAQSYTVESVPNTKLINNSYVSNPDNLLSEGTVAQINQLLDSLEKKTTAQVAVVMLNSIGEADVNDFAQSLFVKWGIGRANKDNGLLILFVQDKKTVRFHTGFGLEGPLPDAICKRIQTQKMVPFFKEGKIDAGILAGIEEVNKILNDPTHADEIKEVNKALDISDQAAISMLFVIAWFLIGLIIYFVKRKRGFSNSRHAPDKKLPSAKISSWQWLFLVYLFPMILAVILAYAHRWDVYVGGMYGYFGLLSLGKYNRIITRGNEWLKKGEYHTVYNFYKENNRWLARAIFFPLPFAFLIGLYKKKMEAVRTYPRDCHKCGKKMNRLDEAAEDEYLKKESQFEETLKSVDYDVWKCPSCSSISIEQYLSDKTEYRACPKCKTYAYHTESTTTLSHATTTSTGEEEIIMACKFCGERDRSTITIPMISTSSDSSSSSSSDSGGSYGGGDSGGGGASSSW